MRDRFRIGLRRSKLVDPKALLKVPEPRFRRDFVDSEGIPRAIWARFVSRRTIDLKI